MFSPLVPYNSTNSELREHGLRVGDVGWFDQAGGFYFCFNVFDAANHPRNGSLLPRRKVIPKNYTPFPVPATAVRTLGKTIEPMTIRASKDLRISVFDEWVLAFMVNYLGTDSM